ncbi:MAG: MotE family protein [Alkalilacustris sp.]
MSAERLVSAGVPARRKPRRRVKGTLTLLACLMLGSAVLRLGAGIGEALARDVPPPLPTAVADAPPPEIGPLLAALSLREQRLAEREAALDVRLQALALAERETQLQIEALEAAEARLAATLAIADQAAERDLARLTSVFEAMKPAEAALLFEEMDPRFAAGFLARMRPEAAAPLMAGLTPGLAYTISVLLAGRHSQVPTQ